MVVDQRKMRTRRIALWLASGLLLLLVAVLVSLWFGNPGVFKPQFERWVSDKTGRELVIEGRLDIDLGRETVIIAEGIRFANAEWSEAGDLLEVGYLELRIDTFSAFDAPLTITLVRLQDVAVRLEQPISGEPNWAVMPPSADSGTESDDSAFDVIVRQIDTQDVRLVYKSPERTGPLELTVATLSQQHRDDDFLELVFDGSLAGRDFDIRAVVGTWEALLAAENVTYDFDAQLDTFSVSSEGTIDDLIEPRRPSLTFTASGPDLNDLLRILKLKEGGSGAIDLAGSIRPTEDGLLRVDIEGQVGQASVDATGMLPDLQNFQQFDVTVRASGPDLSRILALSGLEGVREAPFTIDLDASRQGAMLTIDRAHLEFADASFDLTAKLPGFPGVDAGSASLTVKGSDFARLRELLRLPGAAEGPFSLGLQLDSDANGEEILRIKLATTLGNLEADGRVSNDTSYVGSVLDFTLRTDSLSRFGGAYGLETLPDLPMTARGSVVVEEEAVRVHGPLTVVVENTELRLEGLIARAPRLEGSRLSFGFDTTDLARVVGMFTTAPGVPPLSVGLEGDVQLRGKSLHFGNVLGTFGQSSVSGGGVLQLAPRVAGSRFTFSSSGPALEELLAHLPNFDVSPGVFELSGALELAAESIRFRSVELSRPRGDVSADVTVGLFKPEIVVDFDVKAQGRSVRSILPSLGPVELDDAPFLVTGRGRLRGANLQLANFDAKVGEATIAASGEVDLGRGGGSTDFRFELGVPSLARLGLLKNRRPLQQALSIAARLRGDSETVRIDNLVARVGESDVSGSLELQKGDVPKLSLELHSDSLRLAPLLEEGAADYEAAPKFDDGRVIPDIEVPFDAMSKLNASVAIDVGELRREALHLSDVSLKVGLQDGAFLLHDAGFRAGDGWLRARGALEPAAGAGKATLAAKAEGLTFGYIGLGVNPSTRTRFEINLSANGTDLRTLAGNANGVVFLDGREFTVSNNTFLKRLYGDLLNEILETINPFSKSDPQTTISCIVLPVEIINGKLGVNPEALVRTDRLRIVSDASINLKTEKIEMSFRTTPRRGITISAGELLNPFVMVVGTLAAPRLAVDATGTLITGGAAVATGGLSILARATWDRLVRSRTPCETAAEQGIEVLQDRFAEFPLKTEAQTR
jgi:uncharacterized protein involved in outer membrane biogenesis